MSFLIGLFCKWLYSNYLEVSVKKIRWQFTSKKNFEKFLDLFCKNEKYKFRKEKDKIWIVYGSKESFEQMFKPFSKVVNYKIIGMTNNSINNFGVRAYFDF